MAASILAACAWCLERGITRPAWSLWLVTQADERFICKAHFLEFERGEREMILNGLTGCDGFVFNYLADHADLSGPVSIGEIAAATGYHPVQISRSLDRLEAWSIIARERPGNGYPYQFRIIDPSLSNQRKG